MMSHRGSHMTPLLPLGIFLGIIPGDRHFKVTNSSSYLSLVKIITLFIISVGGNFYYIYNIYASWDLSTLLVFPLSRVLQFLPVLTHIRSLAFHKDLHVLFYCKLGQLQSDAIKLKSPKHFTIFGIVCIIITYQGSSIAQKQRAFIFSNLFNTLEMISIHSMAMVCVTFLELITKRLDSALNELRLQEEKIQLNNYVCELIDNTYLAKKLWGSQILFIVLLNCFNFVRGIYSGIIYFTQHVFATSMACALLAIYSLCSIIFLCQYSEMAKIKAERFNAELFKLMNERDDLCRNDKLRLYVTMKQTVNFTACGFFNIGYPLLTSIIAAATTYLVILLQFSPPE